MYIRNKLGPHLGLSKAVLQVKKGRKGLLETEPSTKEDLQAVDCFFSSWRVLRLKNWMNVESIVNTIVLFVHTLVDRKDWTTLTDCLNARVTFIIKDQEFHWTKQSSTYSQTYSLSVKYHFSNSYLRILIVNSNINVVYLHCIKIMIHVGLSC